MLSSPKVSVICICYNHESYVLDALDSIKNQTYPNIQLIIADDSSTDNSASVIDDWIKNNDDILFLKNSKNLGNTKTFNNAFKYATGEYIVDFAADDILKADCIEEQVFAFKSGKYKNLGIVYGNIDLIDENNDYISVYYGDDDDPESGDVYKMVIGLRTKICSVASMIKKSVFEAAGLYDESLSYEDLDLWVRVSRDYNFLYIPKVLAQKRELPNSLSEHFYKKNTLSTKLHSSTLKIFEKILKLNTSKAEYRIMLKRINYEAYNFFKSRNYFLLIKLFFIGARAFLKSL